MKTSESIINISPALLAVQRVGLTAIAKAKNGQTNSYYAKLPEILATVVPEFATNDLVLLQPLGGCRSDGGKTFRGITTRILHKSGEWMEETAEFEVPAPPKSNRGVDILNASQTDGLVITYGRRYALLSFLGIATGDDNDARELTSRMPDGPPNVRYDEASPWHSLVGGYWQHQDAPGHEGKGIDELTKEEWSAARKERWSDSPAVCASLWDDVESGLYEMGTNYAEAQKPGHGWPADWKDLTHRQVYDLYVWMRTRQKGGAK